MQLEPAQSRSAHLASPGARSAGIIHGWNMVGFSILDSRFSIGKLRARLAVGGVDPLEEPGVDEIDVRAGLRGIDAVVGHIPFRGKRERFRARAPECGEFVDALHADRAVRRAGDEQDAPRRGR